MNLSVTLPDDIAEQWGADRRSVQQRLQGEIALHLYATRQVSMGKAAELSGLARGEFEQAVNRSGVVRSYAMDDLEGDLAFAVE